MSENKLLANPVWEALTGRQSEHAIMGENVARYKPDTFFFSGIPDGTNEDMERLSELFKQGEMVGLMGFDVEAEPLFKRLGGVKAYQMIADELPEYPEVDFVELTREDIPQMAELVKLTEPGPFAPNLLEIGRYIGVKTDGNLVAMAGERIKVDGYVEVSIVCTHPDHRRKGYARGLSGEVMRKIFEDGDKPFLNVAEYNTSAFELYKSLGFRVNREYPLAVYMRQ